MKIAILTSGILPVPAVQGGAVENLIDAYLEYNDANKLHDITVYSVYNDEVENHKSLSSDVNHYKYVKVNTVFSKIKKFFYKHLFKTPYYHYTIEYFLHEAIRDIKGQSYDIIVLENRPGYALALSKVTDAKLIYHIHNDVLNKTSSSGVQIFNLAYKIITVSDYINRQVQTINNDTDKIITVNNGIDLTLFHPNKLTRESVRQELNIQEDDFLMVYSGRVNKEKGIDVLIDALILLKDSHKIKLLVIGGSFFGNDFSEDAFYKSLREKAEQIPDRIIFTGFKPYNKIPDYLAASDLAVIPSVWDDPFPTTVLEAQAMGLPIITTNKGGIPEEVSPENAILLDVDENMTSNLSGAIEALYNNEQLCHKMSECSLIQSKYFKKEIYAEQFLKQLS